MILRSKNVETLILMGHATSGVILSTVRLAADLDYNLVVVEDGCADQLRVIACFDLVANSTDRKANHMLEDVDGKLWSIDHGLTFHAETKIRTVIWDFCGQRIPKRLLNRVSKLKDALDQPDGRLQELVDLLLPEEVTAFQQRVDWVLTEGVYPGLPGRRRSRYR